MHGRISFPLTLLLLAVALLVGACRPQAPVSQAAPTAVATPLPTATPAPTATPTAMPTVAPVDTPAPTPRTGAYTYTVLEELPHDVGAYTRVNIDKSYRLGLEVVGGLQLAPGLRFDANATLSRNKVAAFTAPVTQLRR